MAEYNGSLSVMSGISPEGAIPVVAAKDVWVSSKGAGLADFTSLADVLEDGGVGGGGLPDVTADDAGKFLRVNASGKWAAVEIPYADGEEY